MRYFTPFLSIGLAGKQRAESIEKFGGLPEGFPLKRWPRCSNCGCFQSFSAQFAHHPERLDLGADGRMLFLFQCAQPEHSGVCETWDRASGANAALIVEPGELAESMDSAPDDGLPLENEVFVAAWELHDDGIPSEMASAYFSNERLSALTRKGRCMPSTGTRMGGVPCWVQGAEEIDHAHWRFIGQLDSYHHLKIGDEVTVIDAANYGSGVAYIFVERTPRDDGPRAAVFWQC